MLDQVTKALDALTGEGSFAVEQTCSSADLHITVEGVGPLRFPISAAAARRLCAVAKPAPFGVRDKTLYDARVRDSWEIARSRVKIDAAAWKPVLDEQLVLLRDRLGLAATDKVRAVFDKLLIYGPGQFFAAHQDSERADDMVATLVVELPSKHEGGATVVEHRGEKKVLGGAPRGPKDLSLVAFYADCRHQAEPVTAGYRVVLTYRIHRRSGAAKGAPRDLRAIDRLAKSVKAYFATAVAPPYARTAPQPPDRLIYLLDHEYTQKSLGWDHLKNGDRLRAGALRQVAERLDCDVYLALADVHENWSCEGDDDWGYGRRGRRYRYEDDEDEDEDDGEDDDGEGYELTELIDTEVELHHWIGPDGEAAPAVTTAALSSEMCYTLASVEMDPFKSEHEGYMGNYGNTVDRWYHRAALVMWPRARSFVIRAKVSPSWAVKEIKASLAAGDAKDARAKARSLLPFWGASALQEKQPAFFGRLCAVLLSLGDAEIAHGLLAPFDPSRLIASVTPAFVALVEQYGLAWAQGVFSAWSARKVYGAPSWLTELPRLCQAFAESTGEHGAALARWLLEREVAAFAEQHRGARILSTGIGEQIAKERRSELLALLDAARVIQAASARDALVGFLTDPETALSIMDAGALLQSCGEGRTPAEVRALGLHALYEQVVDALARTLAAAPRSRDDWSMDPPERCACVLCKEMAEFLRAADQVEYAWPLAKERRRHIHGVLDASGLPVTHTTLRSGSPQTLVLKKQGTLFKRAAELRAKQKELLAWLKKRRGWFAEHS